MKKLLSVLVLALALNFLAMAGGVGWLWHGGHLNRVKLGKIKEAMFAPPAALPGSDTSATGNGATTRPGTRLDDLMAKQAGRSVSEQVEFLRRTFEEQMLEMDRRQQELTDLRRQVDLASQKLAADRTALEKRDAALTAREKAVDRLQEDKGFQDSLALYNAMPPKNVKQIFMTQSEQTVEQYLDAMEPRTAAKIIKEFKTPEEQAFMQRVMERMREAQASATDGK